MKANSVVKRLKGWAAGIKKRLSILYKAYSHPKTPWYAKVAAGAALGYALSPIDLIPDFIPILGYLDDLIILPVLCVIAWKLIPEEILAEAESELAKAHEAKRLSQQEASGAQNTGNGKFTGSSEKFILKRAWIVPFCIVLFWAAVIVLLLFILLPKML